jgi:hypothetical protein
VVVFLYVWETLCLGTGRINVGEQSSEKALVVGVASGVSGGGVVVGEGEERAK